MIKTKEKQKRIDYFVGLAMQSFIALNQNNVFEKDLIESICFNSIEFANEMIKQLENEQ